MSNKKLNTFFKDQPDCVNENLKLSQFGLQIQCAPWLFSDKFKIEYSNILFQKILETIVASGLPKNSINITTPAQALEINRQQGDRTTGWFAIGYSEPGKQFAITIDDQVFQIRCTNIFLRELIFLSKKVFSPITIAFSSDDLAKPLKLFERVHTINYQFKSLLRLGNDKIQKTPVKNYQILSEALSLNRNSTTKGKKDVRNAFPSIGAEKYVMLDVTQSVLKEIDGHTFNIRTLLQGPLNEANSLLDVHAELAMDQEFDFDIDAGLSWETACSSFYRDIILKRFLANLLCSTEFSNA